MAWDEKPKADGLAIMTLCDSVTAHMQSQLVGWEG